LLFTGYKEERKNTFCTLSFAVSDSVPAPESLAGLNPFEHYLLQCISIIYEPVSVTFLTKCVALDGRFQPARDEIKNVVAGLRNAGFLNRQNQCVPELAEQFLRQSIQDGWFTAFAQLVEKEAPVSYMYGKWATRCWRALRQFRIGVYSGDFDKIDESEQFLAEHCGGRLDLEPPAVLVVARPFDPEWFGSLPGSMQFFLLDQVFRYAVEKLSHFSYVLRYLEDENGLTVSSVEQVPFHRMLAGYYLLQGRFDALHDLLDQHGDSFYGSGFAGTAAFLRGDTDLALELFDRDLKQLGQYAGPEGTFFFGLTGVFCILALLSRNREGDRQAVIHAVAIVLAGCKGCQEEVPFRFLDAFVRSAEGDTPDMLSLSEQMKAEDRSLTTLISVLCLYWMGVEIPAELLEALTELYGRARDNEFSWLSGGRNTATT